MRERWSVLHGIMRSTWTLRQSPLIIKAGTKLKISIVGDELRLALAPLLPKTSVKSAAGILYRRGRKHLGDVKTGRAIRRMIEARDRAAKGR